MGNKDCSDERCCSEGKNECCKEQECCKSEHCCSGDDKFMEMFCLAKEAKMYLLKEKIKKKLEAIEGRKLDQAADLIVQALMDHHQDKMHKMKKEQEFRHGFESIFIKE